MNSPNKLNWLTRYTLELSGALALYALALVASIEARGQVSPDWLAILVAMSPMLPVGLAFWAILRQYGRLDEMQRRIQAEAFALGAMIFVFLFMAYGFAENAGAPPIPTIWAGPVLVALWGVCAPLVSRRYR